MPRRILLAIATLFLVLIVLGCMLGKTSMYGEDVFSQQGIVNLPGTGEQDVYYPIPYGGPPNLELASPFDEVVIVQQLADRFRVKNTSLLACEATWKARGMKLQPAAPPTTLVSPNP